MERPIPHRLLSDLTSDDEVIIFSGRSARTSQKHELKTGDTSSSIPNTEKDVNIESQYMLQPTVNSMDDEVIANKDSKSRNRRRKVRGKRSQRWVSRSRALEADEENATIADYISNMQSNDGTNDTVVTQQLQHRDLALDSEDIYDGDEWDSADLQDFDNFSSSSEPMSAKPQILRRRFRKSEAQYLVVASGESVDKARWLTRNLLTATTALHLIDAFEERQSSTNRFSMDRVLDEGSSSPETSEDEEDLNKRSQTRISDEHVARLLAKQAELGLAGDDLVLFDGHGFERESAEHMPTTNASVALSKTSIPSGKPKKRSDIGVSSAKSYRGGGALGSYEHFDVMDYERQLMQKNAGGRYSREYMLNLSDSDLQQSMTAAWQSDRIRKKQRKQERELLRAQGLLGKRGKHNVGKKFGGDVAMDDVKRDLKKFLETPAASRSLPPMDKRERKLIHEFAHKSGMKSRSLGGGAARFPVLYKTSRTKKLTPTLEAQIDALFISKSLSHLEKFRSKGIPAGRRGGGEMNAAASYRDGEIVGVGAPEIGMENKGRTMLEKMGWSTGTSLGALNNKGIAQPIEQIVKTSKAGLG